MVLAASMLSPTACTFIITVSTIFTAASGNLVATLPLQELSVLCGRVQVREKKADATRGVAKRTAEVRQQEQAKANEEHDRERNV